MIDIQLTNIKVDNSKSYTIYKPSKMYKKEYKIIFSSKEHTYLQFVLYVKFINSIEINQTNLNKIKYNNFPHNGILYSCILNFESQIVIEFEPLDLCSRIIIHKKIFSPIKLLNLEYIKWDNIFVINLLRRIDRKNKIIQLFEKSNITKYKFIEAFDGLDPIIIKEFDKIKKEKNIPIITSGHFACLLSHIKAINLAKKLGYEKIMILEDDVFFEFNIFEKLSKIKVPYYDLLYLGGITSKKKIFENNWAYPNKLHIMGAYAYILSSNIFDIVLHDLNKLEEYVDFYYLKKIQTTYKTIILNDIIKTDLSSSDTSNKSRILIKRLEYIK